MEPYFLDTCKRLQPLSERAISLALFICIEKKSARKNTPEG